MCRRHNVAYVFFLFTLFSYCLYTIDQQELTILLLVRGSTFFYFFLLLKSWIRDTVIDFVFACTQYANRSCTIPRSTGSVVEDGHVGERSQQQRRLRLERRVLHLHLQNNATARAWEIDSDHQPAAARSATAARRERLSDLHDTCCSIFCTPARQMRREHVPSQWFAAAVLT